MNRKRIAFAPDEEFDAPFLEGEPLREAFAKLRDELLAAEVEATETLGLKAPLEHAANEAAGLAWTTGFPLLVFPGLYAEKATGVRLREDRARRIKERSGGLLEVAEVAA